MAMETEKNKRLTPKDILKLYKDVQEKVSAYRKKIENELYLLCEQNTGHEYWDWRDTSYISVGGDFVKSEERRCRLCGKHEYR
jgi:hypothetical protein